MTIFASGSGSALSVLTLVLNLYLWSIIRAQTTPGRRHRLHRGIS